MLDIYQGTESPHCFKSQTNSLCPDFFSKKVLSDVRSETHLVRPNIVSTGPAKWRVTMIGELRFMTSHLES